MKTALYLLSAFIALPAYAQSSLRPCPGEFKTTTWTNCFGTYTFADGYKYVGEWRGGKRNGQGTFTVADGSKYVGEYRDDKRNGQGTFTLADGSKYVGEFRDGVFYGQGTYTSANGSKYVGEWRGEQRNGQGIQYTANGTIELSGMWANGALSQAYAIDTGRFPFSASSGVEVKDPPIREPNKKTSVGIVNDCLAKGLKPGSSQFSKCVAGQ